MWNHWKAQAMSWKNEATKLQKQFEAVIAVLAYMNDNSCTYDQAVAAIAQMQVTAAQAKEDALKKEEAHLAAAQQYGVYADVAQDMQTLYGGIVDNAPEVPAFAPLPPAPVIDIE